MPDLITFKLVFEPVLNVAFDLPVTKEVTRDPEKLKQVVAVTGPSGAERPISTDAGNHATIGTDGGLYVGPPQYETAQW